jgi:hypothetical protein
MQAIERIEERHKKVRGARVVERIEGCYEAQEVPFGMVYRWYPECLVVECGCGERTTLTGSTTTCVECGTNHALIVQEWLGAGWPETDEKADEALHPWRYAGDREGVGLPC